MSKLNMKEWINEIIQKKEVVAKIGRASCRERV